MLVAVGAFCLASCKPDRSKAPIKKKDMVALLVDVHLAQATMSRQTTIPPDALQKDRYYKQVLDKHGVSEERFDSAVAWYARHALAYKQVYQAVSDTLVKRRQQY